MTQVVSNRTGRERIITAEGENTEFTVEVKKQKNLLRIRSNSKFNSDHNFNENDKVFLQAYESGGIAKEPWSLGTVGKTGEFEFTINDISYDFNHLVFSNGIHIKNDAIIDSSLISLNLTCLSGNILDISSLIFLPDKIT